MADNTLSSRSVIRPYRTSKITYELRPFETSTCVSTAIIQYGDLVGFDPNVSSQANRIVKCSTQATAGTVLSTGSWLGIAVESATADGSTAQQGPAFTVLVALANAATEFLAYTKSSAVTSTALGTRRALAYDSTLGIFHVNFANSTSGDATVLISDIPTPGTDANNPVAFKFLSSALARILTP